MKSLNEPIFNIKTIVYWNSLVNYPWYSSVGRIGLIDQFRRDLKQVIERIAYNDY